MSLGLVLPTIAMEPDRIEAKEDIAAIRPFSSARPYDELDFPGVAICSTSYCSQATTGYLKYSHTAAKQLHTICSTTSLHVPHLILQPIYLKLFAVQPYCSQYIQYYLQYTSCTPLYCSQATYNYLQCSHPSIIATFKNDQI